LRPPWLGFNVEEAFVRKTGLFAVLLGLVAPLLASEAQAESVTFPSVAAGRIAAGPTLTAWVYRPAGSGPFPAVILLHTCGGVDSLTEKWGKRLAGWGYFVVAPDSLGPRGLTNVCKGGFAPVERVADVAGALDFLATRPEVIKGRVAAIGQSHGGSLAIAAVQKGFNLGARGLRGAVAVYPGCNAETQKNIALPLLILSGEKDDWTPAAPCQALQAAVPPPRLEVVVFPGASHGFDNDQVMQATVQCNKGNCHMAYDAKADQETANRTKAFLDRVLH
jgi:dienelactone hydrolase